MAVVSRLSGKLKAFIHDAEVSELLRGAAVAFIFKVVGVLAAFGFYLLLTRNLGADEAGLFFLAVSLAEVLAMACRMGMDQSAIALIGNHAEQQAWPQVKGIYQTSSRLILLASLPTTVGLFFAAPTLANACFNAPRLSAPLRIIAASLLPLALYNLYGESLKGLRRLPESQFITTCGHQLFLLLGMILLVHHRNAQSITWLYFGTAALTAGLGYALWCLATRRIWTVSGVFPTRILLSTSLPLFWTNLLILINSKLGTFTLGYIGTAVDVAVLNSALRITLLANITLLAVNAISAPKFAALHGRGDIPGLIKVTGNATILLVVTTLPIFLAIFCFPRFFMGLFGPEFMGHGTILVIMTIGQAFNVVSGPMGLLLSMTGRERRLRNIFCLATPLHVLTQLFLTASFGLTGTAWAITSNIIIVNAAAAYAVRREFGFFALFPNLKRIAKT